MTFLDSLTGDDIQTLVKQRDFARLVADHQQQLRAENRARRSAVLRHPDLAKRLTEPPMRYATPEIWNGQLPPAIWQGQRNDSPNRAALADIVAEAERREAATVQAAMPRPGLGTRHHPSRQQAA